MKVLSWKGSFEEKCEKLRDEIPTDGSVFIYFLADRDSSGKSWCPDCVQSDGPVKKASEKVAGESTTLISWEVGDKPYWKDQKNGFRTAPELMLKCIPTIVRWGTKQRLEDNECKDENNVYNFFTKSAA